MTTGVPFDSDINMQGNAIHNPAFDAGAIPNAALTTNPLARSNHTGTQTSSTISDLATTVQAYTLDQFAAPAADVSMNSHKITSLDNGVARSDAPNYGQVLDLVNGTPWADAPVILVATSNITLSGEQTIDGVMTSTSRVLVAGQSVASQNGLYVSSTGVWARAADLASGKDAASFCMFIEKGTTYANSQWRCTSVTGSAVVGTNNLTFTQFAAGVTYNADESTLHLSGSTFSVKNGGIGTSQLGTITDGTTLDQSGSGSTLEIKTGGVGTSQIANGAVTDAKLASTFCKKYAATIGDGSTTSITVTHNLGTRDFTWDLYTNSGNYDSRNVIVQRPSTNAATLVFNTAPSSNALRFVAIG